MGLAIGIRGWDRETYKPGQHVSTENWHECIVSVEENCCVLEGFISRRAGRTRHPRLMAVRRCDETAERLVVERRLEVGQRAKLAFRATGEAGNVEFPAQHVQTESRVGPRRRADTMVHTHVPPRGQAGPDVWQRQVTIGRVGGNIDG